MFFDVWLVRPDLASDRFLSAAILAVIIVYGLYWAVRAINSVYRRLNKWKKTRTE